MLARTLRLTLLSAVGALVLSGCGGRTCLHAYYRFQPVDAAVSGRSLDLREVDRHTFVSDDGSLEVGVRADTEGLRVAVQNRDTVPVAIYWRSSEIRIGDRIRSWPIPDHRVQVANGRIAEEVAPTLLQPGETRAVYLRPYSVWRAQRFEQVRGDYIYYFRKPIAKPLLTSRRELSPGSDEASHRNNIERRQGERWSVVLDILRGSTKTPYTLRMEVASADISKTISGGFGL